MAKTCTNVISWVRDNDIPGSLSSRPVRCNEYIAALEDALCKMDEGILNEIKITFGIQKGKV